MADTSTSNQDKVNTTAHLLQTTANHLAHTHRHAVQLGNSKSKAAHDFNYEHMMTHLNGAVEHVQKLHDHLAANYPSEKRELQQLEQTVARTDMKSSVVKKMAATARNK